MKKDNLRLVVFSPGTHDIIHAGRVEIVGETVRLRDAIPVYHYREHGFAGAAHDPANCDLGEVRGEIEQSLLACSIFKLGEAWMPMFKEES